MQLFRRLRTLLLKGSTVSQNSKTGRGSDSCQKVFAAGCIAFKGVGKTTSFGSTGKPNAGDGAFRGPTGN